MKKIIFFGLSFVFINNITSQSISRKVIASAGGYYSGTDLNINYTIGETLINTLSVPNTIITQGFQQPDNLTVSPLQLKAFLQGYYLGSGLMNTTLFNLDQTLDLTATDSVQIELWSSNDLPNNHPSYYEKTILHSNGIANANFTSDIIDNQFYITVKHRNSIETWSANPVDFTDSTQYDFTNNLDAAYGDGQNPPLKLMEDGVYAIYGGDVNQDGTVDGSDMGLTENDVSAFMFGYNVTDCSGDGASDGSDMTLIENNTSLFLYMARPY